CNARVECLVRQKCCRRSYRGRNCLAHQRVRKDLFDEYIDVAADGRNVLTAKVDGLVLRGPANNLSTCRIMALHHNFQRLIEMTLIVHALDLSLTVIQDGKPLHLDLIGNGVMHVNGWRVGPRRVLEAENSVVANGIEQRDGLLEVAIRLARKADDDVCG